MGTIETDRADYLKAIQTGETPGATMMVPTGTYGKHLVGIGHFHFDFNHCNMHLWKLARLTEKGFRESDSKYHGSVFGFSGVSDGISMGFDAMRHSLVSRDILAEAIINHYSAAPYEGLILIPGCDKNMPASAMAAFHLDVPTLLMGGGSIMPGNHAGKDVDIVNVFKSYAAYKKGSIPREEYISVLMDACPGAGACGGMYTANSMFTIFEAMGLSPLNSSSTMATDKDQEAYNAHTLMERMIDDCITPSTVLSKRSFENAVRVVSVFGGSTNPVLHLLAMAKTAGIPFDESDIERIAKETPFLADLMPSGQYRMFDVNKAGGTSAVLRYMLDNGHLDGEALTITGRPIGEELEQIVYDKDALLASGIINPFDNPRLERSHLVLLKGNVGTGWTKISGTTMNPYEGRAVMFRNQHDFVSNWKERIDDAIQKYGTGHVFVGISGEGPKTSPGCPEMLLPSTILTGAYPDAQIGLFTNGRFSGGSVGSGSPVIGHLDETQDGGLIDIIEDGDTIRVDPRANSMELLVAPHIIAQRTGVWKASLKESDLRISRSPADLKKYAQLTTTAREGASMLTPFL